MSHIALPIDNSKSEIIFKTKSNPGYRPPFTLPKYNIDFRRIQLFKIFRKNPISIGRGIHKKTKISDLDKVFSYDMKYGYIYIRAKNLF